MRRIPCQGGVIGSEPSGRHRSEAVPGPVEWATGHTRDTMAAALASPAFDRARHAVSFARLFENDPPFRSPGKRHTVHSSVCRLVLACGTAPDAASLGQLTHVRDASHGLRRTCQRQADLAGTRRPIPATDFVPGHRALSIRRSCSAETTHGSTDRESGSAHIAVNVSARHVRPRGRPGGNSPPPPFASIRSRTSGRWHSRCR